LLRPVYGHFCSSGKGVYGLLTVGKGQAFQVLQKISTPTQALGSIFRKNLDLPKPYTVVALETKNDRRDDDA